MITQTPQYISDKSISYFQFFCGWVHLAENYKNEWPEKNCERLRVILTLPERTWLLHCGLVVYPLLSCIGGIILRTARWAETSSFCRKLRKVTNRRHFFMYTVWLFQSLHQKSYWNVTSLLGTAPPLPFLVSWHFFLPILISLNTSP